MAVREFNGTTDTLALNLGAATGCTYGTYAVILKLSSVTDFRSFGSHLHDSGGNFSSSTLALSNFSTMWCNNNTSTSEFGTASTGVWYLLVMRKATGTATPRLSLYNYSTTSWTHTAGSATLANWAAPGAGGTTQWSYQAAAGDCFPGRVAASAIWSNALPWTADASGDSAIVAANLHTAAANWLSNSPSAFWLYNQASTGTAVTDLSTAGTGTQSAISGTTVITGDDPPSFDFTVGGGGGPLPPWVRESIPISYVASSAWVAPASSTAVAPTYPAGLAQGDIVYAELVIKPDTATVATPANWTLEGSAAQGGGTQGAGTGAIRTHVYSQVVPSGGLTGSQSFTITGGSSPVGCMRAFRYTTTRSNPAWDATAETSYSRTTASTTFGGTGAVDLNLATNDYLVYISGSADDQSTTHTISALAATGTTLGTVTQDPTGTIVNAQGNDISAAAAYAAVTAGASTAAPSATVTGASAETGGGYFYRVRASVDAMPAVLVMAPFRR